MVTETSTAPTEAVPASAAVQEPARLFNRNYLLLWQGQFISRIGNQLFDIAMSLWLVALTGSPLLQGMLLAISSIPSLVLAPVGGVLADRYSRKKIIVFSDLLSGLVVLSLAALIFFVPQAINLQIVWVFLVSFALSVIGAFFGPAISSAVPELVPRARIGGAISMGQISQEFSLLIGWASAGVLTILGTPLLFLINAISFFFAAGSESLVRIPAHQRSDVVGWKARFVAFRKDLADGLRYVSANSGLRALVIITAVSNFFSAAFISLMIFYLKDYLALPNYERWFAWIGGTAGLGALLGFVLYGLLGFAGRARAWAVLVVMVLDAATYVALVFARGPFMVMGLVLLVGATGAFLTVNISTLVQVTTPARMRGRVIGLLATISGSITPLAYGVWGAVAELSGKQIGPIYLLCGVVLLVLALVIAINGDIRTFLGNDEPVEVEGV